MSLLRILFVDTWLTYWHVLLVAMVFAQLRTWFGARWIAVSLCLLVAFVFVSEGFATSDDKDGVFLLGSVMRLGIACGMFGAAAIVGSFVRGWMVRQPNDAE